MTTTIYHGAHTAYVAHIGQCYTTDRDAADAYARRSGIVVEASIDLAGLVVADVDGYNRDEDESPGDRGIGEWAALGIDVIRYEDEDERGRAHDCIRIISDRALSAIAR